MRWKELALMQFVALPYICLDELRRTTNTLCQDSREVTGPRFEARTFRTRSRKDANWTVAFGGKASEAEPRKCHFT